MKVTQQLLPADDCNKIAVMVVDTPFRNLMRVALAKRDAAMMEATSNERKVMLEEKNYGDEVKRCYEEVRKYDAFLKVCSEMITASASKDFSVIKIQATTLEEEIVPQTSTPE